MNVKLVKNINFLCHLKGSYLYLPYTKNVTKTDPNPHIIFIEIDEETNIEK